MVKFDWRKICVSTDAPSRQVHLLFGTSGHASKNMIVRVLYFRLKFDLIILDFYNKQINLIVKIKYDNQKIENLWIDLD